MIVSSGGTAGRGASLLIREGSAARMEMRVAPRLSARPLLLAVAANALLYLLWSVADGLLLMFSGRLLAAAVRSHPGQPGVVRNALRAGGAGAGDASCRCHPSGRDRSAPRYDGLWRPAAAPGRTLLARRRKGRQTPHNGSERHEGRRQYRGSAQACEEAVAQDRL